MCEHCLRVFITFGKPDVKAEGQLNDNVTRIFRTGTQGQRAERLAERRLFFIQGSCCLPQCGLGPRLVFLGRTPCAIPASMRFFLGKKVPGIPGNKVLCIQLNCSFLQSAHLLGCETRGVGSRASQVSVAGSGPQGWARGTLSPRPAPSPAVLLRGPGSSAAAHSAFSVSAAGVCWESFC